MKGFVDGLMKVLQWFMALALAVMTVLLFANVVGRYLFQTGIAISDEISRLCFVWLIFLGAIVAVRERAHIGIDMVVRMMPVWGKRASLVVANALILYALVIFAYGSWQQTLVGLRTVSPLSGLPVAVFAAAGLVAAVGMGLLYAVDLVRALLGRIADDELVQVQETTDAVELGTEGRR